MSRKVALVAEATGIIGRGLVEHLSSGDDWEVIGLFRTAPDYESPARSIPVDLLDLEVDLDGVPEGYAAMDVRRAIKAMVRV